MRFGYATFLIAALLCCAAASSAQAPVTYKGKEEKLPLEVGPQPIAFSHRQHVDAGMKCLDCHVTAARGDNAGLPGVDQCMLCHQAIKTDSAEIRKLAAVQASDKKLQWVRVYEVPGFVFFSHANHLKGGLECKTCHGPVEQRETLAKEVSTSMTTCMNCHAARKVPNHCHFCHSLGQ